MKLLISASLTVAIAAIGCYTVLCCVRPPTAPVAAAQVVGGGHGDPVPVWPFSECRAAACDYYNCLPVPKDGTYKKTRANSHKRCEGPAASLYCSNDQGSTTCYYDFYLDAQCTNLDHTAPDVKDICQ